MRTAVEVEALQQPLDGRHRVVELERQPRRVLRAQRPPLTGFLARVDPALRQPKLAEASRQAVEVVLLGDAKGQVGHAGHAGAAQDEAVVLALLEAAEVERLGVARRLDETEQVDVEVPRPFQIGHAEFGVPHPQHIGAGPAVRPLLVRRDHRRLRHDASQRRGPAAPAHPAGSGGECSRPRGMGTTGEAGRCPLRYN